MFCVLSVLVSGVAHAEEPSKAFTVAPLVNAVSDEYDILPSMGLRFGYEHIPNVAVELSVDASRDRFGMYTYAGASMAGRYYFSRTQGTGPLVLARATLGVTDYDGWFGGRLGAQAGFGIRPVRAFGVEVAAGVEMLPGVMEKPGWRLELAVPFVIPLKSKG